MVRIELQYTTLLPRFDIFTPNSNIFCIKCVTMIFIRQLSKWRIQIMVMKQLLEKCGELPGIQTVDHGGYAELRYRNGHDNGCMAFVPVFPGITLAFIKIQAGSWPAPDLFGMLSSDRGPFIINYCVSGRCELHLNNDSYVYVTENQFSLSESYARNSYIYPERNYNGIEIFVDMEAVEQSTFLPEYFEINMEELSGKYCKDLKT